MVGVKTWTDDEAWFVLKASEITKPNISSTQRNPRPIRYFTDKEIATLCKKNVPNIRHTPDAKGVKYIRGNKKAQFLSPSAPRPSQAVLAAIERLRHQCNTSSQHQDSTSGNKFTTPSNRSRGKLPQVQGMGAFAGPAPPGGPSGLEHPDLLISRTMNNQNGSRVGQIVPQQFQTMSAMNPSDFASSHQKMEGRGFHGPTNMFADEHISRDRCYALYNMEPLYFDRSYQQYGIHGNAAISDSGSQQQHGQAHRERALPTNVPNNSCARMHPQLEQTMNYGQQMGTPMQNDNGSPRIPQQMHPTTMCPLRGNQMGSEASIFEPQMQAYNYGVPAQPPYPPNYKGYTPGLQNLGGNEMMIPPGPTDVGRFTSPNGMPSYAQSNGGIMSHGGQYHGKDQLLAQQADVQFRGAPGATLEAMLDSKFKPPTSHGLSQTTINNPNFTTSDGLQQTTMNTPGSANDPADYFGTPAAMTPDSTEHASLAMDDSWDLSESDFNDLVDLNF
ncbi:6d49cac5-1c7a-4874-b4b8-2c0e78b7a88f [Sclerotinia trifoliorum]|uniref:6d49cac5-1c7a-4874-b4b8-2c0e78b7a88f n=1 Tax=Sclerotinia trifoliorum TaxID=28548 RepID=A0A8H2ZMC2_9HELO|nr:6d49cac5-1c7a-4874-b4b8-2c0e78b7a88f [Sclerotinia trifoliorum]